MPPVKKGGIRYTRKRKKQEDSDWGKKGCKSRGEGNRENGDKDSVNQSTSTVAIGFPVTKKSRKKRKWGGEKAGGLRDVLASRAKIKIT